MLGATFVVFRQEVGSRLALNKDELRVNVPIYLRAQLRGAQSFPAPTEVLQNGDIVNFDITLEENGYIADSSKTYMVGTLPPLAKRLVQVTYEAM